VTYAIEGVAADAEAFREAVDERAPYKPLQVKMKLFFGCNLRCEMCNHWRGHREQPLPTSRFLEVIDELAELGCRKIHFSGGEPLLRPAVPELVERATRLGIRVTMTTNGTLVDKALAKRLIEVGLRGVNVSIDAPERRLHDRVRGVRGSWKLTTRAVGHFSRYARKGKIGVRVNTVVSRLNYRSLGAMPDLVHELGADALNLIPVDDHCGEHLSLRRSDIERFNADVAPRIAERGLELGLMRERREAFPFGVTALEVRRGKRGEYAMGFYDRNPCFAPWTQSLIDFDGKVYVCCMTRERIPPLGDLRTTSFREIWAGDAYGDVRRRMYPPELAPCRRCDDYLTENQSLLQISSGPKTGRPSRPRSPA
jgi:MoaA/NifB/PqqE/SkfB family radical SAM enzyme